MCYLRITHSSALKLLVSLCSGKVGSVQLTLLSVPALLVWTLNQLRSLLLCKISTHKVTIKVSIIIIIIVDIYFVPVSAKRCSWRRPLILPFHYQEIIRTILPFIRLSAANGQLLTQTYQHLDCDIPLNKYPMRLGRRSKQGKVICPGSQHFGQMNGELPTHNHITHSPYTIPSKPLHPSPLPQHTSIHLKWCTAHIQSYHTSP